MVSQKAKEEAIWPDTKLTTLKGAPGEAPKGTRSPAVRPNEADASGNARDVYMLARTGISAEDASRRTLTRTVTLLVDGTLMRSETSPACAVEGTIATRQ